MIPSGTAPGLSPWGRPRSDLPLLSVLHPVVSWLSGSGHQAEPRGADPGPDAVAPLQSSASTGFCCLQPSVPVGGTSHPSTGRRSHGARDRTGIGPLVGTWHDHARLGTRPARTE